MVCLLGAFRVLKHGDPVPIRSGSKSQSLLTILSIRRGYTAPRDTLLDTLWPGAAESLSRQSLNTLVHSLHKRLGDALGGAPPVAHADGYYRLNTEAGVSVDVARFDSLVSAGERAARSGDAAAAAGVYSEARDLYRGDLCVGEDAHAVVERERVRTRYLSLLASLADSYYMEGQYGACLRATLELLAADPCREDGHRIAMRCHVRRGERAQALRQYQLCRAILRAEFDAEPEPATIALFEQVRLAPDSI
jgi:DNA-binding SARP family transcriptional activator